MILGCGTSSLGEELYFQAGFENITNLDFSQTIIDYMSMQIQANEEGVNESKNFENMEYLCIDICDIDEAINDEVFEENSYDLIIDKACLDCIACSEDPDKISEAIANVWRLLVPGGTYFLVSRASPLMRLHLFESEDTQLDTNLGDYDNQDED